MTLEELLDGLLEWLTPAVLIRARKYAGPDEEQAEPICGSLGAWRQLKDCGMYDGALVCEAAATLDGALATLVIDVMLATWRDEHGKTRKETQP
ncbi:MAG: hypothetical protein LBL83_11390 [Clostridiales bacterium]|jgi:hypothetical protein|nr:hypothetical protein [Clostridiales bacterium]